MVRLLQTRNGVVIDGRTYNTAEYRCKIRGTACKSGYYKKANLPFGKAILSEPEDILERITGETEEWATHYIKAMKGEGSADKVLEVIDRRADHNAAPDRKPINPRSDYTADKAPNRLKATGNFDD